LDREINKLLEKHPDPRKGIEGRIEFRKKKETEAGLPRLGTNETNAEKGETTLTDYCTVIDLGKLIDFEFWLRHGENDVLKRIGNELQLLHYEGKEIKTYDENPDKSAIFVKNNESTKKEITKKKEFPKIDDFYEVLSGKYVQVKDVHEINLLDWKEYFNKLEEDKDANAFFRVSEHVRKTIFGEGNKEHTFVYDARNLVNHIRKKEESDEERIEKRKIVCKYPLEFDKTIYLDGDEVRGITRHKYDAGSKGDDTERHFKDIVHATDIWGEIKPLKIPKFNKNSFWFAHPVYFINHLDKAGLLDNSFNPYEGKYLEKCWVSDPKLDPENNFPPEKITVLDNPGFAPTSSDSKFIGLNGQPYADITGLFDQMYEKKRDDGVKMVYPHEGVDFRGSEKETPIHSLITAKIIDYGAVRFYGRTIILADIINKGINLLGHLSAHRWKARGKGDIVYPGETVGYVGGSNADVDGNIFDNLAHHLHVSYYDSKYEPADKIEDIYFSNNKEKDLLYAFKNKMAISERKNPFKHDMGITKVEHIKW